MNIFVLDLDPVRAAQYQHDRHVVKMVLESAQILCTVAHIYGRTFPGQYKPTHARHPCVLWAGAATANWQWLYGHALALSNEYTHRYGKQHRSRAVINAAWEPLLFCRDIPNESCTPFAQAMPEQYRQDDAVSAYRAYYIGEKIANARWTRRAVPAWITEKEEVV